MCIFGSTSNIFTQKFLISFDSYIPEIMCYLNNNSATRLFSHLNFDFKLFLVAVKGTLNILLTYYFVLPTLDILAEQYASDSYGQKLKSINRILYTYSVKSIITSNFFYFAWVFFILWPIICIKWLTTLWSFFSISFGKSQIIYLSVYNQLSKPRLTIKEKRRLIKGDL